MTSAKSSITSWAELLEARWQRRLKSRRHRRTGRVVNPQQCSLYTTGDCHYFSVALSRVFRYPMYILWDDMEADEDGYFPIHALVHVFCNKRGKYIDVNGVQTYSEFWSTWGDWQGNTVEKVSERELWDYYRGAEAGLNREYIRQAMQLIADNREKYEV